jgi:flagellar M-ring protein FliF
MSAPVAQRDSSKSSTNTQPLPNGRPGTVPNGVGNTQAAIGTESGAKSETSENLTENQLVVTHGTMSSKQAPLTPKKVKVSIGVPSSYYDKVWREQNPPADGAEQGAPDPAEIARIEQEVKKEIEEAVVNLVPAPAPGVDAYTPVRVTSFTDIPLAAEPEPDMVDEATSWLAANWPTLGMSFLGLVSLLMLRSMLRSGAAAPTPTPDASAARAATRPEEEEQPGETVEQAQQRKLRARRAAGGPSLRDELVEMVKEDPDAAANILRSWIGDAA